MRRSMRRALRNAEPEIVVMPENYVPRHAELVEFIAEILEDLCEALDITPSYIAGISDAEKPVAEIRERGRKIGWIGSIHLRKIPMPEIPERKFPSVLEKLCGNPVPMVMQGVG